MGSRRQIERRQAKHAGLTLEHSFLFRIPRRFAWIVIAALLFIVGAIEFHSPKEIWFGPVYLAVIALAAWSLSSRIAIAIGLLILTIRIATGNLAFFPNGSDMAVANIAVRVFGIAIVVGFIGMARKSCEREWRSARTDPLTGALNRQAFFEIIESDQSPGGWSAIIYADLDGLKRLNDEEGHDQGDLSLKIFSETVRNTIRKGDVFARMGGDEFVIFMNLKNEEAGEAVARRLHEAINGDAPDSPARLECSLGILLLPDGSKSIDEELRAADELMYQAKKSRSGVLVSTLVERDGKATLSRPVSALRQSSVRKAARSGSVEAIPSDTILQDPVSHARA